MTSWAPVWSALAAGRLPVPSPALQTDELALLVGPPLTFWLCVWFWNAVILLFPKHAVKHVLGGPQLKSPSLARVISYTLCCQATLAGVQYALYCANSGRAPAVPGGFSNTAEWKAVAMQMLPALLIMDVYYYWCHRFLHLRLPYRYIHKMHHRVHVPYCSAGFYLHPAEVLLLDQGAAFVAATLFPSMRFWTVLLLQLLLPIRACHEHLGYVFPWDIDNSALGTQKVTHHGIHHQPAGHKFNYSTPFFTVMDDIFGTRYRAPAEKRGKDE